VRRRYRQDPKTLKLVEIPVGPRTAYYGVKESFISPVDGEIIRNSQEYHEHNARNGVIPWEPGIMQDYERDRRERSPLSRSAKAARIEALRRAVEKE
jgi:hypothetical protein